MAVAEAIPSATNQAVVENETQFVTHKASNFWLRHPGIADDLLYILDVYAKCDQVPHTAAPPDLEDAYTHVFGSSTSPACERCYPRFHREKRILESLTPR
ncbi:MAG: hypothetical protein JWO97_3875 [Acidobacteria bacterium]|nr:hypothetical protein [Acidobacteriota bacterium]